MSFSELESATINNCMKQLRNCAEFISKASTDLENDLEKISIEENNAKKEHSKEFEKIKRSFKKIYKEAKQKLHDFGRSFKDNDENNLDLSFIDKEKNDEIAVDAAAGLTDPIKIENGNILENLEESEEVKVSDISNVNDESNKSNDGCKNKIRLVAIEKLLDPKVIASSTNLKPIKLNLSSSSVIVLDSDDDITEDIRPVKVLEPKKALSKDRPSSKVKRLKINIKRCKIIASLLKEGKRKIKISKMDTRPQIISIDSNSSDSDSETIITKRQRSSKKIDSYVSKPSKSDSLILVKEKHDTNHSKEKKSSRSDSRSTRHTSERQKKEHRHDTSRSKSRIYESDKSSDADIRNRNKKQNDDKRDKPGTSSTNKTDSRHDEKRNRNENNRSHSKEKKSSRSDSRSVDEKADRKHREYHNSTTNSTKRSEKRTKSRIDDSDKSSDNETLQKHKRRREDIRDQPGTSTVNKNDSENESELEKSKNDATTADKNMKSSDKNKNAALARNTGTPSSNHSDSEVSINSRVSKNKSKSKTDEKLENAKSSGKSTKPSEEISNNKSESENSSDSERLLDRHKKKSNKSSDNDTKTSTKSSDDEKNKNTQSSKASNDGYGKSKSGKSSDEEDDEEIFTRLKRFTRRKRIRTSSCSETPNDDDDNDDENDNESESDSDKKKKKTKRKSKRGSDSDAATTRKNIRQVIKTKDLEGDTKKASEAEKERRKRLEERQKLYNQIFEKPETIEIDKMVLDFDEETKEELLSIDKGLLKKLKPHQVNGVKFMWDSCFETLKDSKEKPGSGCILGHCMGLGKTLQVVALAHTLLASSEKTGVNTVLVITPLSTVTNWAREFETWMRFCKYKNIDIYDMSKFKDKRHRLYKLKEWNRDGGICILGYDMYRILVNPKSSAGGKKMREALQMTLVDPGPDLIVCDEGHLLKNEKTSLSQAVSRVRTQRRIVLSGTPLQNNLKEYYCMIQFVKPNLLGTYKEYLNRFVNPITNGQYTDSTERDIRFMKNRSHVLHKMLEGCIQRRDYSVLAPYLPPKHEYVIFIGLSEMQKKLYESYMGTQRTSQQNGKGTALFQDFQNLRRIWTHPMALRVNSTYAKKKRERKMLMEEDEDSIDDFICDDSETSESEAESTSSSGSDSENSAKRKKNKHKASSSRRTRQNAKNKQSDDESKKEEEPDKDDVIETEWWMTICSENELSNIYHSPKLLLLFEILQECESIGDKVLLFSQSLQSLDVIENFLSLIHKKTQGIEEECDVNGFIGSWVPGTDYFRLDGSHSVESREYMCKNFNNTNNYRSRLFLISTRAGSLGINLVAANRVIIFDASWNPSHDTQSIFRVYRFGQNKPCYIYRFIAKGTMEEKVYERQVTKQATAKRVIDEQQIGRHYNQSDLLELYQYDLKTPEVREVPILPKDRLFADLLSKHESIIINYHEHDSLLENKESEHLNEEERKAAWSEYEAEKDRPQTIAPLPNVRQNYRNGPVTSSKIFGFRTDILLRVLNMKVKRDYPQLSDADVGQMVPRYLRELYEQMNVGNTALHTELVELSVAMEAASYYVNPISNYMINPFYQAAPPDPTYIHEID